MAQEVHVCVCVCVHVCVRERERERERCGGGLRGGVTPEASFKVTTVKVLFLMRFTRESVANVMHPNRVAAQTEEEN